VKQILKWAIRLTGFVALLAMLTTLTIVFVNWRETVRLKLITGRPAQPFVVNEPSQLALDHVRIIDGTGAPPMGDQTIVLQSGKIAYVGPYSARPLVDDEHSHDFSGRTVIPGLVGMHDHLFMTAPTLLGSTPQLVEQGELFPLLYLAAGVTTIRTTGSIAPEEDIAIKQRVDLGKEAGPEIFLTAPYLEGSPPTFPEMHGLANANEARNAVDTWASRGMTSFKAYMMITPDELRAAAEVAHARKLKITGHLCTIGIKEAAELGIDNIEHGLLTDTEFYSKKQPDKCPEHIGAYLRELNSTDVRSAPIEDMITYLVDHHVAVTSTLAVFESELGIASERTLSRAEHALSWKAWELSKRRRAQVAAFHLNGLLNKEMEFEREFVRRGGTLLAGCDPTGDGSTLAGFGDQREVELLVQAGFTPPQAIKIATANGAEFLGISDQVGTISLGKQADLVVVRGDPAANISDIERVEMIFRHGTAYDPAKLLKDVEGVVGLKN
jgi:imidazolonepropionase-like amidohydrolase